MHDYSRRMKVSKCGQKRDPVITSDVLNDDDDLNLSLFHVMHDKELFREVILFVNNFLLPLL